MLKNKVQLITYPNSLGDNLDELQDIMHKYLKKSVGGIHILPFYPSSADRGFAPLTHMEVDMNFGNWDNIKSLSKEFEITADLMINHLSAHSEFFLDYLEKKEKSKYNNLFLKKEDIFGHNLYENELSMIYRPRHTEPFYKYSFEDGTSTDFWCTFTPEQIDLNWKSEITKKIVKEFIINLCENGVKLIRLDAIGYIFKKRGTSSFFIHETFEIMKWIKSIVEKYDAYLLPEVHKDFILQLKLAKKADYVYDFSLPPLMLYTIYFNDSKYLKNWIDIRPTNQVTVLDTHDGIGLIDATGQIPSMELQKVIDMLYNYGGNATLRATGEGSNNVDIYQINCTFFSALGSNEEKYLMARAIQFFIPGIPQIYYVGMLAGENDIDTFNRTKVGRDINRHNYSKAEFEELINKPIVKSILKLMEFRNTYNAFNGEFEILETPNDKIQMKWQKGKYECFLTANLLESFFEISYFDIKSNSYKVLELDIFNKSIIKESSIQKVQKVQEV